MHPQTYGFTKRGTHSSRNESLPFWWKIYKCCTNRADSWHLAVHLSYAQRQCVVSHAGTEPLHYWNQRMHGQKTGLTTIQCSFSSHCASLCGGNTHSFTSTVTLFAMQIWLGNDLHTFLPRLILLLRHTLPQTHRHIFSHGFHSSTGASQPHKFNEIHFPIRGRSFLQLNHILFLGLYFLLRYCLFTCKIYLEISTCKCHYKNIRGS